MTCNNNNDGIYLSDNKPNPPLELRFRPLISRWQQDDYRPLQFSMRRRIGEEKRDYFSVPRTVETSSARTTLDCIEDDKYDTVVATVATENEKYAMINRLFLLDSDVMNKYGGKLKFKIDIS